MTAASEAKRVSKLKRPKDTPVRTPPEWAWEFLRRNPIYRERYRYWKEDSDKVTPYSEDDILRFAEALEKLEGWGPRYRPWVKAGLSSGKQFIVRDRKISQADIADLKLDPMQFMLNEWLDPDMPIPDGKKPFDLAAGLSLWTLSPGSDVFGAAMELGLANLHRYKSPSREFAGGPALVLRGGETINIQFDLDDNLAPQLLHAIQLLVERQDILRIDDENDLVMAEVQKFDVSGTYTQYIELLDLLEKYGEPGLAVIRYQKKRGQIPDNAETDRLTKACQTALRIRDKKYRSLAFYAEAEKIRALLGIFSAPILKNDDPKVLIERLPANF